MGWFNTIKNPKLKKTTKNSSYNGPTGIWKKCVKCQEILQTDRLDSNQNVCPYCDHHYRLTSAQRIENLFDKNSFQELEADLTSHDPLKFKDKSEYKDRIKKAQEKTGLTDSCVLGIGTINGQEVACAVMDFHFMGGSMGVVCGEKIAKAMDIGLEKKIPVIVVSCSGGARMQEGILSLMQMGKTSASRSRLRKLGIPYISILTDPTTGGCAASFSMLGDINLAEPNALIGFAGPRVIEQSIRQKLPEGFQRSEFLKDHGFVDRIVHRNELKKELSFFLKMFSQNQSNDTRSMA